MKKASILAILSILSVLFMSGCRFHDVDYTGNAKNVIDKEQAKATIQRIMSEQFSRSIISQLSVNDIGITFTEYRRPIATLGAMNSQTTINFATPYNIEIFRHRRTQTCDVVLWNGGAVTCEIACFSMAEAMQFADAYNFMHEYNLNQAKQAAAQSKSAVKP
jgi:hypothetical protein